MMEKIKGFFDIEEPDETVATEMEDMVVNSQNAVFEVEEPNGNALLHTEEELESSPVVEDNEVTELGSFRSDESTTSIVEELELDYSSVKRHSAFFHPDELEAFEQTRLSKQQIAARDRVTHAINSDSSLPDNRTDLFYELAKREGKVEETPNPEDMDEAERERYMLNSLNSDNVKPEHPLNKSVDSMTGRELQKVMNEAVGGDTEEEELEATDNDIEEEEADIEISELSQDKAVRAASTFLQRGGAWADMAEDIVKETQTPDTQIETTENNEKKITTKYPELKVEIMQATQDSESNVRVTEEGDYLIATFEEYA